MNRRIHFFTFLIVATAALYASPCAAQRWVVIHEDTVTQQTISADAESISKSGSLLKAWFKYSFKTPQTGLSNSIYKSFLELSLFDCMQKTHATKRIVFYADSEPSGPAIKDYEPKTLDFRESPPNTMGAFQVMLICRSPLTDSM